MVYDYVYSPHPVSDYVLHGLDGQCEMSVIPKLERGAAVWNLFWLSIPTVDNIPGSGPRWNLKYHPVKGAGAAIVTDVGLDEVLYRKLSMHPTAFVAWFEREDHSIYDTYNVLNGPMWVDNVLRRARESAHRMAMEVPALRREGNVIHAMFGRKAA